MTFSWTYLINVTLLDTATINGCINNGLITFTDSPARNSNSLSAPCCIPKTLGLIINSVCRTSLTELSLQEGCFMYSCTPSACVAACACAQFCQIILAAYLGRDGGFERETFVTNQRKWRAVDLPRIFQSLYLS